MKCIQSIKETKNVKVGVMKKVTDREADSEVKSGYWKCIPKSEWRKTLDSPKNHQTEVKDKKSENRPKQKQKQ